MKVRAFGVGGGVVAVAALAVPCRLPRKDGWSGLGRRVVAAATAAGLSVSLFAVFAASSAGAATYRYPTWPSGWRSPLGRLVVSANYGAYSLGCPNADRRHTYTYYDPDPKSRSQHLGLDLSAPPNTKVYAISDGRVLKGGNLWDDKWKGVLLIEHVASSGEKFTAVYGHVAIGKNPRTGKTWATGDAVRSGEQVAVVADLTIAGDHLHFGIAPGSKAFVPGTSGSSGSGNCPNQPSGTANPESYLAARRPRTIISSWPGVGSAKFLGTSTLASGKTINRQQYLLSPDAQFVLILQSDGNLVLYSGKYARWSTKTAGKGATRAVMQSDGNFVLYTDAGKAVWSSGTAGKRGARLDLQTDGNIVIRQGTSAIWASKTVYPNSRSYSGAAGLRPGKILSSNKYLRSPDKRYVLLMQSDGNLVLYAPGARPLWSSKTNGSGANRAVMQTDGNFVVYTPSGKAVWHSKTAGYAGASVTLQSDGNLVIYQNGVARWNTRTAGKL